jgi:hypothetical protein
MKNVVLIPYWLKVLVDEIFEKTKVQMIEEELNSLKE